MQFWFTLPLDCLCDFFAVIWPTVSHCNTIGPCCALGIDLSILLSLLGLYGSAVASHWLTCWFLLVNDWIESDWISLVLQLHAPVWMCSFGWVFVIYFLVIIYVNIRYYGGEDEVIKAGTCQSKKPLASTFKGTSQFEQRTAALDSKNLDFTPFEGRAIHSANEAMTDLSQSFPWRCPCGRLNKKVHVNCPLCKTHWSRGTKHDTTPYKWDAEDDSTWNWESYPQEKHPRSSTVHGVPVLESARKGSTTGKARVEVEGKEMHSRLRCSSNKHLLLWTKQAFRRGRPQKGEEVPNG